MRKLSTFHYIIVAFLLISTSFALISSKSNSKQNKSKNSTQDSADTWAKEKLASMSLEEKIGQFFMVSAYSNQGEQHLKEVENQVCRNKVGGIIFFAKH